MITGAYIKTLLTTADVGLDPSMAAMQRRRGLLTPAWLQSVAAALGTAPVRTVVIGASELPLNVRPRSDSDCPLQACHARAC